MIGTLLHGGYSPPTDMGVDDMVKFAVDSLWRVRTGYSDEVGITLFTQQTPQIISRFAEATARVRQLRSQMGTEKVARALAALDNLENSNFTNVGDMFDASFATYKELFGMADGELASTFRTSCRWRPWSLGWTTRSGSSRSPNTHCPSSAG